MRSNFTNCEFWNISKFYVIFFLVFWWFGFGLVLVCQHEFLFYNWINCACFILLCLVLLYYVVLFCSVLFMSPVISPVSFILFFISLYIIFFISFCCFSSIMVNFKILPYILIYLQEHILLLFKIQMDANLKIML